MRKQLARVRRMMASHERGRGRRYPAEVQEAVVDYALQRRAQGGSWAAIADELGMWFETVRRWCARVDERDGGIVPVEVVENDAPSKVVLVSPSGFRLEGLGTTEAIAALKELG